MPVGHRRNRRLPRRSAVALPSLRWVLGSLPRPLALVLGRLLGRVAWYLDGASRRTSLANLERAFGERIDRGRRISIGRSAMINLAAGMVDLVRLPRLEAEDLAALVPEGNETLERITRAVRSGRGIILLAPHLGNWELLPAYLAIRGAPVHYLARPPRDPRLRGPAGEVRRSQEVVWLRRGGVFARVKSLLEDRGLVVLSIDQEFRARPGVAVPFFGEAVWTPRFPAALARLTGAVVLPGALLRRRDHRYRLLLEAPIRMSRSGDEEYDDWENSRRFSLAVESLVERFPAQWTWSERRWGTFPVTGMPPPPRPPGSDLLTRIRPSNGI
jgi:lauroyl/myristoyl acyltransferase